MRAIAVLAMVLAGVGSLGQAKEMRMKSDARTHCVGRYLIDLPPRAQIDLRSKFARAEVVTSKGVASEGFKARITQHEDQLKAASHNSGGSLFVGRNEISPTQITVASWLSPASLAMYRYDLFSYFPIEGVLYRFTGRGNANERALGGAYRYQELLAEDIRHRLPAEIPEEHGFCIDSGLIARSNPNQEEVTASIRLPGYPSVTVTFMSYVTGNPDSELLRRTSTIPPGYEEVAARMRILRRGNRDAGNAMGQELLVRGDGEGKKAYEFLWESQGQADSLEYPFLSLQLSTTGESDEKGEVIDAPFASDEEAMALWDSILGTLRLRPGAVAP